MTIGVPGNRKLEELTVDFVTFEDRWLLMKFSNVFLGFSGNVLKNDSAGENKAQLSGPVFSGIPWDSGD